MENEAITAYRQRRAAFEATCERHLAAGVVVYSADGILIDDTVEIAPGAVILPGVTIGDDTVIGAGSVVTKDIPAGVVAVGCPCRVLRPIGPQDRETYFRGRKIDVPLE